VFATGARADDSGGFVVKLGQDTTSIERYTRSASRLEVNQVGRSPRVLKRRFVYDLDKGNVSKFSMVVTPPGSEAPTQTITGTFPASDSSRMKIETPGRPAQSVAVKLPPSTLVITNSSPWAQYEGAIKKLMSGKSDSLRGSVYFVGGTDVYWLSLRKQGPDAVAIMNERGDHYQARVDKSGKILSVTPLGGTQQVSVERVDKLDLEALTAGFAAREKAGAPMGTLSPRDSVKATAAGASIWIDYSRPSKRGRVIFGNVVPYGEVWRTGANAATQFKTDKSLDFGGTIIPAGFYTIWTVPSASGWKLIFNSETGQSGTAHKAEKDIATIDMKVDGLSEAVERFTISVDPSADGGVLRLDWDQTRASAAFRVVN
jgi:hypothetical protein